VDMSRCPTYSVDHPPHLEPGIFAALEDEYGSLGVDPGIFSISVGDIMKVSKLLEIASIDLEDIQGTGRQTGSVRYEGEVVIVEINYRNYREWHKPNSLPPVYEYNIYRLPTGTYKITEVIDVSPTVRKVRDIHGIHVVVRVSGLVGKFSWKETLMSLIGGVGVLSIVSYTLTCLAFNCIQGENGDKFYNRVHQEMNISHAIGFGQEDGEDESSDDEEGNRQKSVRETYLSFQ